MVSFKSRFKYRFDSFMGKGGASIFISLTVTFFAIFALLSIARGALMMLFPLEEMQHELNFWGNAYITFLELTDPGNMAQDIGSSPLYKFVGICAGMLGVIMFSSLIAFITTALDQKLDELKRGHSKVIEDEHTLILGWDEQRVVEIINELVIANESEKDACVVLLADKDKVEMDDILKLRLGDTQTTRVVTRSGNTSSLSNLNIVSVDNCKSVIILASCDDSGSVREKELSDAKVIQTILAVTGSISDDSEISIIAEIYNPVHRAVVSKSFQKHVVTVDTSDILAKLLVQTSRSVGLSVVYSEILSFDGCEMYFYEDPDWAGLSFHQLAYHFPDGVPMGVRQSDGTLLMNPHGGYQLQEDDSILIVADDDSTIEFRPEPVAKPRDIRMIKSEIPQQIEKELILGWSHKVPTILSEYADYVKEGSEIDIMVENPSEQIRKAIADANEELSEISIRLIEENQLSMEALIAMKPFNYDNIIILANSCDEENCSSADSKNIVTLLLFREIFEREAGPDNNTKLITEILDSQNHSLISQAGVKDVIISNQLISMILAQISENANIKDVYDDIFEEDGSEIYLKPLTLYQNKFPMELSFASMMWLAQQRGEVCIGVKIKSLEESADDNFGVKLIPGKTEMFTLTAEDSLVVLSEDEF